MTTQSKRLAVALFTLASLTAIAFAGDADRGPRVSTRPNPSPLVETHTAGVAPILAGEPNKHSNSRRSHSARGAVELDVETIEGLILVPVRMTGPSGVDTSGLLVLDTGAGFVALDLPVALRLGVADSDDPVSGVELAEHALDRLELGNLEIDHVDPVLVLDAEIIRRATGRNVLGLAGVSAFRGRGLWLDYDAGTLTILDSPRSPNADDDDETAVARSREVFESRLSSHARAARFDMAGDEKMIVRARLASASHVAENPWLDLVLDTGATKSVLFEPDFSESVPEASTWRSLRGLVAPTLVGAADAKLMLAPIVDLEPADHGAPIRRREVDCAVVESDLGTTISSAVGSTVYGLLGYSFLRDSRIGIDCTNHVVWLDPTGMHDERPYEYSQVGLQLERVGDAVRVLAVAEDSPAEQAGIEVGDELVTLAGKAAAQQELVTLTRALEGPPGTRVKVVMRRDDKRTTYTLVRRRLL